MGSFNEIDDTIIYQDEHFMLCQDILGNTYYKAKCSKCGEWFGVDFNNVVKSINGIKVGNPLNPTIVSYPYKVYATIESCVTCGYRHVFDAKEYAEFTKFKVEDATETCYFRKFNSSFSKFEYKIFNAELIAKYILGNMSKTIYMVGNEHNYYNFVKKTIISGKVMDSCLLSAIMIDIIDNTKLDDNELAEWYDIGLDFLTIEQLKEIDPLISSLL